MHAKDPGIQKRIKEAAESDEGQAGKEEVIVEMGKWPSDGGRDAKHL